MLAIKIAIKCCIKKHSSVHLIFIFFCKNISLSTFSAKRRDLLEVTMSPAVEKTRSLGTDVPWTARLRWANLAMWGYLCSLLFHHASGSSSTEMWPCMRWPLHEWGLTKALFFFPLFFKNLQIPLPWQIFSGEERSLMALAPLLRMNWLLGLHCFDPDEYMTK